MEISGNLRQQLTKPYNNASKKSTQSIIHLSRIKRKSGRADSIRVGEWMMFWILFLLQFVGTRICGSVLTRRIHHCPCYCWYIAAVPCLSVIWWWSSGLLVIGNWPFSWVPIDPLECDHIFLYCRYKCVNWTTFVCFLPYMVSDIFINVSSLHCHLRSNCDNHHPDQKHQNNHSFTIIVRQAPCGGGEDWGEGKIFWWNRRERKKGRGGRKKKVRKGEKERKKNMGKHK